MIAATGFTSMQSTSEFGVVNEDCCLIDYLEHIYDRGLVRASKTQEQVAGAGHTSKLGYCARGIYLSGAGNRSGSQTFSVTQLKILQECITLVVFTVLAYLMFGERLKWNHATSNMLIVGAVFFAFKF